MWGFVGLVKKGSAPLKCISRTTLFIGVITIYAIECVGQFSFLMVLWTNIYHLCDLKSGRTTR